MATTDTLIVTLASALIESYEIDYAVASLLFYDYIICFGEEVEHFWAGPWSLSRLLYLAIRYMSLGFALFSITADRLIVQYTTSSAQILSCALNAPSWASTPLAITLLMVKLFGFVIPISTLCQLVITLRIWFLFSRNLVVKAFAVALLIAATVASILLVAMQYNIMQYELLHPLLLSSSSSLAWVYVPSLIIHTVFFALKVYRFLTRSVDVQTDSLLWGFVKEGMFMYVFALASLVFGVVGLAMVEPSQISVRLPAAAAGPIVAAIVVSTCRVMLSIRSVAATAHVDPEWLLNRAELSRVHWRRGSVDGEIIVETGELVVPLDIKSPQALHVHPTLA